MLLIGIIKFWFLPMPLAFLGCVLGLILLFFSRRAAISIIILALLQLWFFSLSPVANFFYYNLTKRHPPVATLEQQVDYIAVLGSSHRHSVDSPIFHILSPIAIQRLLEGVRLFKDQKQAYLWLSGIKNRNRSHPALMREGALALGVPANRTLIYENVHNTRSEIKALKEHTADGANIVIVSSSHHLPRAALWAKFYQLFPLYVPSDTFIPPRLPNKAGQLLKSFIPSVHALSISNRVFHEYLGIAHWYILTRLRLLDENS